MTPSIPGGSTSRLSETPLLTQEQRRRRPFLAEPRIYVPAKAGHLASSLSSATALTKTATFARKTASNCINSHQLASTCAKKYFCGFPRLNRSCPPVARVAVNCTKKIFHSFPARATPVKVKRKSKSKLLKVSKSFQQKVSKTFTSSFPLLRAALRPSCSTSFSDLFFATNPELRTRNPEPASNLNAQAHTTAQTHPRELSDEHQGAPLCSYVHLRAQNQISWKNCTEVHTTAHHLNAA